MENSQPEQPQPVLETLRTVEFRLGLKGYNVDEVDEYLEKAAVEADGVKEQLRQMTDRLRQANERVAELERAPRENIQLPEHPAAEPVPDETLQKTLMLAQKFVDQTRRDCEAEAAEIVAQADERARSVIAEAEDRARVMASDSERRLREEVTRLESMRGQLASDVENMARHLESERNKLRSTLSEVLKWIDENVQPANALMALRPRGGESRPSAGAAGGAAPRVGADAARGMSRAAPGAPGASGEAGEGVARVLDMRGVPMSGFQPGAAPPNATSPSDRG